MDRHHGSDPSSTPIASAMKRFWSVYTTLLLSTSILLIVADRSGMLEIGDDVLEAMLVASAAWMLLLVAWVSFILLAIARVPLAGRAVEVGAALLGLSADRGPCPEELSSADAAHHRVSGAGTPARPRSAR